MRELRGVKPLGDSRYSSLQSLHEASFLRSYPHVCIIWKTAIFFLCCQKNHTRPHIAYLNRFRPSVWKRLDEGRTYDRIP